MIEPGVLVMVSIYDTKAEAWMTPLFFQSGAQALRSFGDAVNDGQSEFAKHPEDYCLFRLGTFSAASGEVTVETPSSLGLAVNLVRERAG